MDLFSPSFVVHNIKTVFYIYVLDCLDQGGREKSFFCPYLQILLSVLRVNCMSTREEGGTICVGVGEQYKINPSFIHMKLLSTIWIEKS